MPEEIDLRTQAIQWAEREAELACELERSGVEDPEKAKYGVKCYEAALAAFKTMLGECPFDDMGIQLTRSVLNRLISRQPLTPVHDVPEVWNKVKGAPEGIESFQCSRMTSLFKEVGPDEKITYRDVSRVSCVNISNPGVRFHNSLATRFIDKLFPITMPYLPSSNKFILYRDECIFDPKNKDADTVAFLYVVTPDGEKHEINRFFKKMGNQMMPIKRKEFEERKVVAMRREG